MATNTKIELMADGLTSLLVTRFYNAANPLPVIRSYDSSNDLYLTLSQNGTALALIKFEVESTMAQNMVGIAQQVYTPHVIKVAFKSGVQAEGTATLDGVTGAVRARATATLTGVQALAAASGTFTLLNVVATETCTINGVTFIGRAAAPLLDKEFLIGATDEDTATNLATAINLTADAGIDGIVTATAAGTVVTIAAVTAGAAGNNIALAVGQASITRSGATLTGGSDADTITVNGVVFTAVSGAPAANQFQVNADNNVVATNLRNAINASVSAGVAGVINATSALKVVTIAAVTPGTAGNALTLTESSGGPIVLAPGTGVLAGGIAGDTLTFNGVTFIALANAETVVPANYFKVGANNDASATNLAAAFMASASAGTNDVATAVAAANVVTFQAREGGLSGNVMGFTKTGASITLDPLSGHLEGGTADGSDLGVQSKVLFELSRMGTALRVYAAPAVAGVTPLPVNDDTYLVVDIKNAPWGSLANV